MRFSLIVIAGAMLIAAPATAADWKLMRFPDQGFGIESPVPLVKGAGMYQGAVAGRIPTITYSGELNKISYKVTVIDVSSRPAEALNLYEEMEALLELQGKVIGNDSMGIEPGKLRQYGRELVIQAKDGSLRRIGLMYQKGKLYQAEATILPGGDMQSFDPERFADSIIFDLDPKKREERCADPDNFKLGTVN
ncbi:MAG TPA: hypothetical protein VFW28_01720 [Micropepsaceae bacterium]|nr:hypothetical protein [Micropepsaceae bacterium]